MEIQIQNKTISQDSPTFIIAELSANHKQDIELAKDTICAMKESGADAVKLQT
jgi:pseudaminic acid synthase